MHRFASIHQTTDSAQHTARARRPALASNTRAKVRAAKPAARTNNPASTHIPIHVYPPRPRHRHCNPAQTSHQPNAAERSRPYGTPGGGKTLKRSLSPAPAPGPAPPRRLTRGLPISPAPPQWRFMMQFGIAGWGGWHVRGRLARSRRLVPRLGLWPEGLWRS